ncbi:hypothetical protein RLK15_03935 [Streptococcus pneumoniae]|nr:hypothetical protein [Streptococcus pneumoniae]MDS3031137.1 hypothetical protein [Streptococcus pneumoniae]MDS4643855.1 hypothetical protein [Streptococcus pneumoniae]MDS4734390.1 hypothetical protein [Streptococcus pneumoniae]MDS4834370.1 hypothetical protein [Streptococcus pneumoniae]
MNDIRKQSYYSTEDIDTAIQAVIKASNTFIETSGKNNINTLAKAVLEAKKEARGGN